MDQLIHCLCLVPCRIWHSTTALSTQHTDLWYLTRAGHEVPKMTCRKEMCATGKKMMEKSR